MKPLINSRIVMNSCEVLPSIWYDVILWINIIFEVNKIPRRTYKIIQPKLPMLWLLMNMHSARSAELEHFRLYYSDVTWSSHHASTTRRETPTNARLEHHGKWRTQTTGRSQPQQGIRTRPSTSTSPERMCQTTCLSHCRLLPAVHRWGTPTRWLEATVRPSSLQERI